MNAFVTMSMWNWFIVPLGVINITVIHAFGIGVFIRYHTKSVNTMQKTDEEKDEDALKVVVLPIIVYIIAYIIKINM
jgi:hypothetical protein